MSAEENQNEDTTAGGEENTEPTMGAAAGAEEAIAADPDAAKPFDEHTATVRDKIFAFIARVHAEVTDEERALETKLGMLLLHLEKSIELARDYLGEQTGPQQQEIDANQEANAGEPA